MLDSKTVELLEDEKNLLAFSSGIDSTALFFILIEYNIPFDIAIVNYHTRKESDEEVAYAIKLAHDYDKNIYIHNATLSDTAYEEEARQIRYDFFDSLMQEHGYTQLLTAHQLNDQLEWFLMQLSKGAGMLEMLGMQTQSQRLHYKLCRPLLDCTKDALKAYLDLHKVHYFVDSSNSDLRLKRNFMRHNFSDHLLGEFHEGIKKSFRYIQEDQQQLLGTYGVRYIEDLTLITAQTLRTQLFLIDKDLKKRGYLLSGSQRDAIMAAPSVVIGAKYIVERLDTRVYIAPVIEDVTMTKAFKEICRVAKVPLKLRPFLFHRGIDIAQL